MQRSQITAPYRTCISSCYKFCTITTPPPPPTFFFYKIIGEATATSATLVLVSLDFFFCLVSYLNNANYFTFKKPPKPIVFLE